MPENIAWEWEMVRNCHARTGWKHGRNNQTYQRVKVDHHKVDVILFCYIDVCLLFYLKTIIQCLIMNKPVKKRIRKNESSCRLVECYYCGAKKEYKDLKSHCKHVHNKPLRQKGQLTISETSLQNISSNSCTRNTLPTTSDPHYSESNTRWIWPSFSDGNFGTREICGPRETFGTRSTWECEVI